MGVVPHHWNVSIDDIFINMPETLPARQALPVLLREILNRHDGSFDPSSINHYYMGRKPRDDRAYQELNRLLNPGELKIFVEQHPEFAWEPIGKKGMIIKWG